MKRRRFIKTTVVALAASNVHCTSSASLDEIIQEEIFSYFIDVLVPAHIGLRPYQEALLTRLQQLTPSESSLLIKCYTRFKKAFQRYQDTTYTLIKGENIMGQLLQGQSFFISAAEVDQVLDIIYRKASEIGALNRYLWQRDYSVAGRMCAYWDNYDEPVVS